ncbi:MAG: hypothetical protein D6710_07205 [Nitrospirae bacterium]|nr:MAG: hypothetical protein D6710_07205 [Nitrospirota bacterium]
MKRLFSGLVVFLFLLSFAVTYAYERNWKDEFDDICGKVQISETLSTEELKQLIKRAEKLLEELKKLNSPEKKVYIFRLKKCKSFFEYIIELRSQNEGA